MAKKDFKKQRKSVSSSLKNSFRKENLYLFIASIAVIVLGYIALSRGPWNSFLSLTVAPILLVLGYCVMIPLSILYRKREKKPEAPGHPDEGAGTAQ